MENETQTDFVTRAAKAYELFTPFAEKYHYRFRRIAITCQAKPCMVFLGNHSSGKSSMINWILGECIQDTGLAPTDDGFTFIMYGERDEFHGLAALEKLPAEFAPLKNFGDAFIHSLRVKFRPSDVLKHVTLVDSPGMIDSAEKTVGRNYNFEGVVRSLVELCDMVFYMFDPDKPGTTGETVNIFAKCLYGVTYKLRILLNKCDGFSSLYDFARTYGTLCWNLARVLKTKDMPKIWTVYSGSERTKAESDIDLSDFNRCRDEFCSVVRDGDAMRRDNLVSQAGSDFLGLSIRMRMLNLVWRKCLAVNVVSGAAALGLSVATWLLWCHFKGSGAFSIVCASLISLLVLAASFAIARFIAFLVRICYSEMLDGFFQKEYRREIAIGVHDDLVKTWEEIREETAKIVKNAPLRLPFFGERWRKKLDRERASIIASFAKV